MCVTLDLWIGLDLGFRPLHKLDWMVIDIGLGSCYHDRDGLEMDLL